MFKKILIPTFIASVAFCVLSFISVVYSLFQSVGKPSLKPVTNIGFPFKYYYQVWLSGSDSPNCGWNFNNFLYDVLIIWILTLTVYVLVKRKKSP